MYGVKTVIMRVERDEGMVVCLDIDKECMCEPNGGHLSWPYKTVSDKLLSSLNRCIRHLVELEKNVRNFLAQMDEGCQ